MATEKNIVKYLLDEASMPTAWYNVLPDLPYELDPPLHPVTMQPLRPEDLAGLFPPSIVEQEALMSPSLDIPGAVLDVYRLWRPTPLLRARRFEAALGTKARIYYKYEGVSPAGSHKPNTAVAQAYYNKLDGTKRLATETGAGQWGSALSMACAFFGLECSVYMVRASYDQKPYRRALMQVFGADVVASPSDKTQFGRAILKTDPDSPGSLGIAISEAVEDTVTHPGTKYSLGSVLNHVLLHQTIIGLEAQQQMELAGEQPDIVVGCCGGGSNFGGIALPFLGPSLKATTTSARAGSQTQHQPQQQQSHAPRAIAVEPTACPSLTRGAYAYDFGDSAGQAPVVKMYTLGHSFIPPAVHAGGLRYHGMSPLLSSLHRRGLIEAVAVQQLDAFEAATLFAKTEGILPAPESAHAIAEVVRLTEEASEAHTEPSILFCLSGHGHFDLSAYEAYHAGRLVNHELPQTQIDLALHGLPRVAEHRAGDDR
ncbi:MAG: TrpB-like pyridoxal phosphate-dependent enzyme [Firmicutes bacterium]|nr:TrpB-like pyridoxal phosphate-dependent enzyme [Bacillota bacterium]